MDELMNSVLACCLGAIVTAAACVPTAVVSYLAIRWLEERRNRK